MEFKKVYVNVVAEHGADGSCRPRAIRLDTGQCFDVDNMKQCCRAAGTRAGGSGLRYTVTVCGRETFLFDEGNGRWFVEMKVPEMQA